jgi:hypothetical protein
MQKKSVSVRRMNRYAPQNAVPVYRASFFHREGGGRVVEQGDLIEGRKAMTSFLEQQLHRSAVQANAIVSDLDEERSWRLPTLLCWMKKSSNSPDSA